MEVTDPLLCLSPLDGRYHSQLSDIAHLFSEYNLIRTRVDIEIKYLLFLSKNKLFHSFSSSKQSLLRSIVSNFSLNDAREIKNIERKICHDVKAVEIFIRNKMHAHKIPWDEYIHFGLTSEDVNNLVYSQILKTAISAHLIPIAKQLVFKIAEKAEQSKSFIMLGCTHGQPAVPTTIGKEFSLFAYRINKELQNIAVDNIEGKLNGAVGNYNALFVGFAKQDWLHLSARFVKSLGLIPAPYSTQILAPDSYLKIFQCLELINSIIIGFVQDIWRYISDEYVLQKIDNNQVGSSTMPQKINPIDFENCEGNLGMANAFLHFFITKLPISRLQRDLSDSTVKRNFGSALAYCYLGYNSCLKGLEKITFNENKMKSDLLQHWEIVTEGIQTILRRAGDQDAYERLRRFCQGKKITHESLITFINSLNINKTTKNKLLKLTPLNYAGSAVKLTEDIIHELKIKNKEEI